MPPGPGFNWYCVASSLVDVLGHAAHIRAEQVVSRTSLPRPPIYSKTPNSFVNNPPTNALHTKATVVDPLVVHTPPVEMRPVKLAEAPPLVTIEVQHEPIMQPLPVEVEPLPTLPREDVPPPMEPVPSAAELAEPTPSPVVLAVDTTPTLVAEPLVGVVDRPGRNLQSSAVPSSRLGRLFHYGSLAANLGYGAASEIIRRTGGPADASQTSVMMTEANITRLVTKLSKMRGAALKLGQFLSIQDTHLLPPEVDKVFRRVQDSAHYMPDWQMEKVMTSSLGPEWLSNFDSFDRVPFAAASIGQVHSASLSAPHSPTGEPMNVAIKIQFPNIANSIASDFGYIKLILTAGRLLPKGLFLDRTIEVMKQELKDECDYVLEAGFARRFGSKEYLGGDARFKVPWIWNGSTDRVLVMEHVYGRSVGEAQLDGLSTADKNDIAARIIELCLRELFHFRMMQTDPNWTNFLWNAKTRQVELVDFGATREYSKEFMDKWLRLLQSAAAEDRDSCIEWSLKLGYLTGEENEVMLDAHVKSMMLLAAPFKSSTPQPFSFGKGTLWDDITTEIRAQIPVMLQHRLTPPPRETYSLNRKLSGAFLLASRLGATVNTKELWDRVVKNYVFEP